MKALIINGKKESVSEEKNLLFGSFMEKLYQRVATRKEVICSIKVDGNSVSEDDEKTLSGIPIERIECVEITTADPVDLSFETLESIEEYIDRLVPAIRNCAVLFNMGQKVEGEIKFLEIIQALDIMTDTLNNVIITLKLTGDGYIKMLQQDLLSILKTILEIKNNKSWNHMAEILVEHLEENLREWKIKGLEHIKSRKSF